MAVSLCLLCGIAKDERTAVSMPPRCEVLYLNAGAPLSRLEPSVRPPPSRLTLTGDPDRGGAERRETRIAAPAFPRVLRQLTLWRRYLDLAQLVWAVDDFFDFFLA